MNILTSYIKLLSLEKQEKEFFYFVKHQLGYTPHNVFYYKKALTHKSALQKKNEADSILCNERLEFLGDSILDSVIADYLFRAYSHKDEGFLTQMRAKIVNRKSLNEIAISFRLDKYIKTNNLVVENNNVLGNAFEALIGAIYLDMGYDFAREFIIKNVLKKHYDFHFLEHVDTNFKSRLIEVAQKMKKTVVFESVEEPSAEKGKQLFVATIIIDNQNFCQAKGHSKKDAEQNAAKCALQKID